MCERKTNHLYYTGIKYTGIKEDGHPLGVMYYCKIVASCPEEADLKYKTFVARELTCSVSSERRQRYSKALHNLDKVVSYDICDTLDIVRAARLDNYVTSCILAPE